MLANGPTIGIKALKAADWHLALPMSLSGIGLFLTLALGVWMARLPKLPFAVVPGFAACAACLGMALSPDPLAFLLLLGLFNLFDSVSRPAITVIIRLNYPAESRGWVTGRLRRWSAGTFLLAGLATGWVLDRAGTWPVIQAALATAAALLEDMGPSDSIRRSFDLTRDFAGRAFMIYLLYFAMAGGVVGVFQLPFFFLIGIYAKQIQLVVLFSILLQVGSFIGNVLVAPVSTIGFALFYYDLRVRKEAFDLQMMMRAIGADPLTPPITGGVPSAFGRDAF